MENDLKKDYQRQKSKLKRNILNKKNLEAPITLEKNLLELKNFIKYKIIASYLSTNSELSTKFLNKFLLNNKKILCLPVVKNNSKILSFKKYNLNSKLVKGKFGIFEPVKSGKNLLPEIILTPCLAFDMTGFRLGYGGGYYDKTITYLKKKKHKFISIAIAFDDQKVKNVIHNNYDQRIDYILTEKKLYRAK
tara:strand:+ start:5403 stop:5978 length:576 start_codon:yes stop_codon:yes gene_type:complete